MSTEIEKAIASVSNKDYKDFESSINSIVKDKMKTNLEGFVNYLEKNTFQKNNDQK
ncbi:hypothetical protein GW796_06025 [archaeon]|nr:hypothetical protein [archaeon]NCQ51442.1 hypothetical protein [archaeon]NCT58732.1 hypothetical protein [archaeon]